MLIRSLRFDGFLSFAPGSEAFELRPLNVLIGPNGSGKTNVIEALGLLAALPTDLAGAVRRGGGAREWIWKGRPEATQAVIEVVVRTPGPLAGLDLRHRLALGPGGIGLTVLQERISEARAANSQGVDYYRFREGAGTISALTNDGAQWVDILLVDAEAAVTASPRDHLRQRDGWGLGAAREGSVHLMAQVMETWIVADPDALDRYYGQGFNRGKLPRRSNLEREPKPQVLRGLKDATKRTSEGGYHKIRHAGKLLARIDPARVRDRCGHCDQFFNSIQGTRPNRRGRANEWLNQIHGNPAPPGTQRFRLWRLGRETRETDGGGMHNPVIAR